MLALQQKSRDVACNVPTNSLISWIYYPNKLHATVTPAITTATIDISLIRIFIEGPHVSLNGSPTVSPTILALWHSLFLPP